LKRLSGPPFLFTYRQVLSTTLESLGTPPSSTNLPSPKLTLTCSKPTAHDNHGKHRWAEKNDPALPPGDASAIQAVTPSDIFNWQGPTEYLVPSSERIWSEQKWYALTGRVVELRAEEDGDLHIALQDASGDKPGIIVAEIPAKAQWCELRKIVFGWTEVQFPFRVRSGRKLKLSQPVVVTVIGKAFFDIGHAPADHSNRRTDLQGYAAWEIHPVMKLDVR
jgi:hypothetical protein